MGPACVLCRPTQEYILCPIVRSSYSSKAGCRTSTATARVGNSANDWRSVRVWTDQVIQSINWRGSSFRLPHAACVCVCVCARACGVASTEAMVIARWKREARHGDI